MSNQVKLGQPSSGGMPGRDGNDGASAYELAVEKGYTGTLSEWLTDLGTNVADNVTKLMDFRATWDPTAPNAPGYGGSYQSLKDLVQTTPDGAVVTVDMVGSVAYSLSQFVDVGKREVELIGNGARVTVPTVLFNSTTNRLGGGFLANDGRIEVNDVNWDFGAELPGTTGWREPYGITGGLAPEARIINCSFVSRSLLMNRVSVCHNWGSCSSKVEVSGCSFSGLMSVVSIQNWGSLPAILRWAALTFTNNAMLARSGTTLYAPGTTLPTNKFIANT